jgi:hypothetical protein
MTMNLRPRASLLAFLALLLTSVPARADVILDFTFDATNDQENAQLFTYDFVLPFATGPYDTLSSQFSTTVTDLDNTGAAGVFPADASGFMMVPSIDATQILAAALGAGCTPLGAPGFTATCDPSSTASVAVVTLASGVLGASVSFFLSGGDSITGQGQVRLSNAAPVAEPVSMVLVGLGIGVVAARRRFWR